MKRIFIIVGILIGAVAIVVVGMLLRDRSAVGPDPMGTLPPGATLPIAGNTDNENGQNAGVGPDGQTSTNETVGGLPTGGIRAVAQAAVLDYAINADGVAFIATNGAIISASTTEILAQANFGQILSSSFSPDGNWLVVRSGNADISSWNLLDVDKKTWRSLQANTTEVTWSPNSAQIAYMARRTDGSSLTTYSVITGATRTLAPFSAPDLTIEWKGSDRILIMDRPNSLVPGTILDFGVAAGTMTTFATNAAGAEVLWGGTRSGGLVFRAGPTGGTLSAVGSSGNVTQTTNFLTLPSKCVFGESAATSTIPNLYEYVFCAVPENQQMMREKQLPQDYLLGEFGTVDTIYAINLRSGILRRITPGSSSFNFSATNLKVYGENLYFLNQNDKRLYEVALPDLSEPTEEEFNSESEVEAGA